MKIEKGKAYKALFKNGICDDGEVLIVKGFESNFMGMNVIFENKEVSCPMCAFDKIFEKV